MEKYNDELSRGLEYLKGELKEVECYKESLEKRLKKFKISSDIKKEFILDLIPNFDELKFDDEFINQINQFSKYEKLLLIDVLIESSGYNELTELFSGFHNVDHRLRQFEGNYGRKSKCFRFLDEIGLDDYCFGCIRDGFKLYRGDFFNDAKKLLFSDKDCIEFTEIKNNLSLVRKNILDFRDVNIPKTQIKINIYNQLEESLGAPFSEKRCRYVTDILASRHSYFDFISSSGDLIVAGYEKFDTSIRGSNVIDYIKSRAYVIKDNDVFTNCESSLFRTTQDGVVGNRKFDGKNTRFVKKDNGLSVGGIFISLND